MPTRSLNVLISADERPLKKAVNEGDKDLGRLESSAKRTGAALITHIGESGARVGVMFKQGITPLAGIAAGAGLAAGAALSKGIADRLDVEEANTKLKVQLGLTAKESARMGKLAGQLYAGNYGDSLGEVNDALKNVIQNVDGMGKASGARLKGMTSDVISVSKAFDQDLGGTTRAVGQMMRTGLAKDGQDALNIITKGFQEGADKSGDFLDTLNEYGTQFRNLGIDGKTATGLLTQGLQAGARDADIVADSLKEFGIRAVDGSDTTKKGFESLGLDADKMAERIGKGGESAAKGLDKTLDRLRKIKDPVKQSQTAVELFGTQAEDLGDALFALDPSKAVDGLGKVAGAARRVNSEMGDTPKSKITEFWRTLQTGGSSVLSKVTPLLGDAAGAATDFVKGMRNGSGAGGEFAAKVGGAVDRVKSAVSGWVKDNRSDINSVINAFRTVGRFAKDVFEDTLVPIVRRSIKALGPIFSGVYQTIRGVVRLVSGLLSGDWDKAWDAAKDIVKGAFKVIKTAVITQADNMAEIIKDLGPKLVKGIGKGLLNMGKAILTGIWEGIKYAAKNLPGVAGDALKGIGKGITSGISKGFGALNPFGDGIGVSAPSKLGLSGGNSLMGADSDLGWIASAAGRFGLHTSSGLRPGAITSSGNQSFHASGDAVDEAGSPAGMLGFFRYMKSKFGGVLRELIFTPGGVGIKDGRPFRYSGQVAQDHYDHVHVAFTGGAGDGIGRKPGTGDGIGFRGLEDLWVQGKGSTKMAPLMAHIAQAESGGDPNARNPSGASGLWQILGQPFPGNVFDPLTNAKMAVWKYRHQGLGAWAASRGTWGKYVGSNETYTAGGSRGSSGGSSKPAKTYKKNQTASGGGIGKYDPSVVYATENTAAETLPPAVGRQTGVQGFLNPVPPRPLKGGGPSKGLPSGYEPPAPGPTEFDYLDAALAEAELTAGTDDDLGVLRQIREARSRALAAARASGDPRAVAQAARDYKSADDAVKSLEGVIQDNTDAIKAHTAALEDVSAQLRAQTEFAKSVTNTSNFQLTKTLADLISGQIVGYGVAGRAFTPGSGVAHAY